MARRRGSSSRGDGAFALVLLAIIGLPLTLLGYVGSPSGPASVPTAYAALPGSTGSSSGTLTYYGGFSPDTAKPAPQAPAAPETPGASRSWR